MPDSIQSERFQPRSVAEAEEGAERLQRSVRSVEGTAALRQIVGVTTASSLVRPRPATVSSGVAELDALVGGIPSGALTEIIGPESSGRTTCLLAAISEATRRGEVCAVVDVTDAFDPQSAAQTGVDLDRVLWVRCTANAKQQNVRSEAVPAKRDPNEAADRNSEALLSHARQVKPWTGAWPRRPPARSERQDEFGRRSTKVDMGQDGRESERRRSQDGVLSLRPRSGNGFRERWGGRLEQALKATDMLLQSGGFGLVAVDFGDVPADAARRVPLTSWFRFRRAVENTPTVLLVLEQQACAKSCASLVFSLSGALRYSKTCGQGLREELRSIDECPAHARLLDGITVTAEVMRGERKPVRSARTEFKSRTAWNSF